MNSRGDLLIRSFFVVAIVLGASLVVPAAPAEDTPSWCAYLVASRTTVVAPEGTPRFLLPLQARYEVDLLGNLAHGSLHFEFANTGETDLYMKLLARRVPGLQLSDFALIPEEGAEARPLKYESVDAGPKKGGARGRSAANAGDAPQRLGSDEVVVGAEESISIRARFTQTLGFRDGRFRLSLPTLGGACESDSPAANASVPLSVTLRVHHDEPLELAESSSHGLLLEFEGDHTVVETVGPDTRGRTPFEFDYALGAANEPALSSFVTPRSDNGERDVLMIFAPSIEAEDDTVRPKELLFVLDTSGSMGGGKLDSARGALGACLEQLNETDRFNLIQFDGNFSSLFAQPQEASVAALGDAVAWLQAQESGGSTTLLPALDATLKQLSSEEHHRLVVVLTDGAVADEAKVLQFLQEHLDEARLFFVGVGAEPNRDKVRRLAEFARGSAVFADDPQSFAVAVQELFAGISAPLAWDLRVEWGDAEVLAIDPPRMPDLYTGRPVTVRARVKGELPPTLVLEAATTGGVRTFEAVLPEGGAREYPQVPRVQTGRASSKRVGAR